MKHWGVFIALAGASQTKLSWLGGFLIFLVLDVTKPFPTSWLDANLSGGFGIMIDDIAVGLCTLILLIIMTKLTAGTQGRSPDNQT